MEDALHLIIATISYENSKHGYGVVLWDKDKSSSLDPILSLDIRSLEGCFGPKPLFKLAPKPTLECQISTPLRIDFVTLTF